MSERRVNFLYAVMLGSLLAVSVTLVWTTQNPFTPAPLAVQVIATPTPPQGGHVDVYKIAEELDRLRAEVETLSGRYLLLDQQMQEALHDSSLYYSRPTQTELLLYERLNAVERRIGLDTGQQ